MRKVFVFILVLLLCSGSLMAQGEIDEQQRVMLRDESSFGAFLNSNGFGLNYRYGFWRNARNQFILDGDFDYVKHPKEIKSTGVPYDFQTHRFVYGKENLFWELKGTAGWQKELYRKIDRNGISVRLFYAGGLTIGFTKPIYYKVFNTTNGEITSEEYLKFDPSIQHAYIGGRGPFFKGFNELKVIPGLTAKAGFSFEYSHKDAIIHALDAGVNITVYPKKIPIMATEQNNFLFFNLSVGYRFGRIIDISEAARSKTRKEKRAERKAQRAAMPYQIY
jgi:hypothetical protein